MTAPPPLYRSASRAFLAACLLWAAAAPASARVLVIGIDGASWPVLDAMIAGGALPHLAALIERGGSADLETVEPVSSPVVWTSVATGRTPEDHGVTDFFSTRAQIKVPTVYERLAASGHRVGLYDVLMSWPPASLPNGFVVPGWLRRDDTTWPTDALDGYDSPLFRTVYQEMPSNRAYLEQAQREVAEKARSWGALAERYDPEVGAVTFYGVDAASHRYWHASFPEDFEEPTPAVAEVERDAVRRTLAGVDRAVGELVAGLAPEDSVIVVSDHGFQAREGTEDIWMTQIEPVLDRAGFDLAEEGVSVVGTFFAVSLRIAPGPFAVRDATVEKLIALLDSFETLEGDALFYTSALDVAPRPASMARPFLERVGQWFLKRVMDWGFDTKVDPTAQALVFGLPRGDRIAPLWPDSEIRVAGEVVPISHVIYRQRFTGTHHPTAVFIAAGGPIARRAERGRLSVLDVAPLVSYLAGSPIPDDFEHDLPVDWIEPARLAAMPSRVVPGSSLPGLGEDPERMSDVRDPALVEKLRTLGYIE
ncbi:MAG: alkaline phosphatase family protein [Myxococcales bacterium]|nr:alkaline phosphatase family protein [Myxococcales bacterium]